ncbi:MAG: TolC family protein [Burkholderiaceae bacterium]
MWSAAALAVEPSLTLTDAQHLALQRSGQLAARDFSVSASRSMAVAAGQLPDPVLRAGIDSVPINGADRFSLTNESMTTRYIGVSQEVTSGDKRELRARHYTLEARKELAQKTVATAAIERDTARAWLDRYYAEATARVIARQRDQVKLEIRAAEGAYRAGRGSQADILAARSLLADFDNRASETQRRVLNATTMLVRWIGETASKSLSTKPDTDRIRLNPATLDTQLAHHPEIDVLTMQEDIAVNDARLAKANKKSDWSVSLSYGQRGPAYSNLVSIGVSIPFQWDQKNRQDQELSAKLALVGRARAERQDTLFAQVAATRSLINEWTNDRERYRRYERELIPLAADRITVLRSAYRSGKASLADVLAARRNEIDVRIQALQLAAQTDQLWAQLNFLFPTDGADAHSSMTVNEEIR